LAKWGPVDLLENTGSEFVEQVGMHAVFVPPRDESHALLCLVPEVLTRSS
jgi:hypothetical protein